MRKHLTRFLTTLAFLATPVLAIAQSITLPPSTVYGRLGISAGPGQAIPFSVLKSNLQLELSILDYGGSSDCTTSNNTALASAIAALPAGGGTIVFPVPGSATGCYAFATANIQIGNGSSSAAATKTNIRLVGRGTASAGANVTNPIPSVRFKYTGASLGGYFIKFNGPGIFGMENIELDSNPVVYGGTSGGTTWGLWLAHTYQSVFKNLSIKYFNAVGMRIDSYRTLPSGVFIGGCRNSFNNISISSTGIIGTVGVDYGWDTYTSGTTFDNCQDTWDGADIGVSDHTSSVGIVLRAVDATSFKNVFTYSPGGCQAWGVFVIPPTGYTFLPHNISFYNSAIVGGISTPTDGSWTPRLGGIENQGLNFYPLQTGDMWNPSCLQKPVPTNVFGGLSGFTSAGNIITSTPVNAQTGTTYTFLSSDSNSLVTFSNGSSVAVTLPQSSPTTSFGSGFRTYVQNFGAGRVTITPTTSTINGAATLALEQDQWAFIFADAAGNYKAVTGQGRISGTSGGIPYFSSATTLASSGALTANAIVKGGGAGAAPTASGVSIDGSNNVTGANSITLATPLNSASGGVGLASTPPRVLAVVLTAVNFNSVADTAVTITLPTGYTRYQIEAIRVWSASASLAGAQYALYTDPAAAGTAILSPTATTVTATTQATNLSLSSVAPTIATFMTDTTLFFRVTTAVGSAATATVGFLIQPMP